MEFYLNDAKQPRNPRRIISEFGYRIAEEARVEESEGESQPSRCSRSQIQNRRGLSCGDAIAKLRSIDMSSLDFYAIEDLLTAEEQAIRDRARQFVQEEAMPEIQAQREAVKKANKILIIGGGPIGIGKLFFVRTN